MQPFKVLCVNDSERPNEIPISKWLHKGRTYTVIQADALRQHKDRLGFVLKELNNSDLFPYTHFNASRFALLANTAVLEVKGSVFSQEFANFA